MLALIVRFDRHYAKFNFFRYHNGNSDVEHDQVRRKTKNSDIYILKRYHINEEQVLPLIVEREN